MSFKIMEKETANAKINNAKTEEALIIVIMVAMNMEMYKPMPWRLKK